MERNYGLEIDTLRDEIKEIKLLLSEIKNGTAAVFDSAEAPKNAHTPKKVGHVEKMVNMHPDPALMTILDRMENSCGENGNTGRITYLGVFASGERQSTWIRNDVNTDELLPLIENRTAEKVLSCIGNNDRLNIMLALLKKPMTVSQIIDALGYNSTGQVYHHLKPLIAADLIYEDVEYAGKGVYAVRPHRVQGIIMLLAAISDMVDPSYTRGSFEE